MLVKAYSVLFAMGSYPSVVVESLAYALTKYMADICASSISDQGLKFMWWREQRSIYWVAQTSARLRAFRSLCDPTQSGLDNRKGGEDGDSGKVRLRKHFHSMSQPRIRHVLKYTQYLG